LSERCFVRVRWDPVTAAGARKAVGGFLRYIQHRDLHPDSVARPAATRVAGLLKYAAYRDGASRRAEMFGPHGPAGTLQRKEFAAFVTRSIEGSRPQLFRARDGRLIDRRRAVSRFLISPERADGLDLQQLVRVAVGGLEAETSVTGLRWIAAIHRNTAHHHVHLVLAGLYQDAAGIYHRVEIPKRRLAAMKEALAKEIERQRGDRAPGPVKTAAPAEEVEAAPSQRSSPVPVGRLDFHSRTMVARQGRLRIRPSARRRPRLGSTSSLLRLQAVARAYAWRMAHDEEAEAHRRGWENSL